MSRRGSVLPLLVWSSLAVAVLVTVVALAWTIRALVGRLRHLGADLERLHRELTPALERLQADAEVTSTELAALGDQLEERAQLQRARRPRRWRPRRGASEG
ncbi:MAG: hypothetical protein WEB03_15685 [Nitriliruptor sp.]|uniref:hypothetical protein n=1 Tax=Nitriliruptor sp. TaxID=2448056 RepID=UPI0034A07B25